MKYYKLLKQAGWGSYKAGKIYPENYDNWIGYHATGMHSSEWQEVSEGEYLLQEAKERYPIGTKFKPAHIGPLHNYYCIVVNNNFRQTSDSIIALTNEGASYQMKDRGHGNTGLHRVVYYKDKWAEIVSKSEEKMEDKKLIGYKLVKPEFATAASLIVFRNKTWISTEILKVGIEDLKEAGVLDLWFAPVYGEIKPKFKVGDWVIGWFNPSTSNLYSTQAWEIGEITSNGYFRPKKNTKHSTDAESIRLATREEIGKALTEQFLEKWQVEIGEKIKLTYINADHHSKTDTETIKGFNVIHRNDAPKGNWSWLNHDWFKANPEQNYQLQIKTDAGTYNPDVVIEKIPNAPDIEIRGYKCEYYDDYVKIGCRTFTKDFIYQLANLIESYGLVIEYNDDIIKLKKYFKSKEK